MTIGFFKPSGAAGSSYASHATAALAAAAAADGGARGGTSKRQAAGRVVSGADVVYMVDQLQPGEGGEIPVQPITVLKSDMKLAHVNQIAANSLYIAYGLRAGQLRIINKASAGRALYKGHAAPIADAAFFSASSNLLASASADGDLRVRMVCEVDDPSGSSGAPVPLAAPVMRASLPPPPPGGAVRLAWHPTEPRVLAAASGGAAYVFMVPAEPAAPACEAAEAVDLAAAAPSWELALPPGAAAASVAFSPSGDLLVAGDAAGGASAWVLESAGAAPGAALTWAPHGAGGGPVAWVAFLEQAGPGAPSLLVTGDATNRRLALWRLPGAAALAAGGPAAAAERLQSLELGSAGGAGDFFCHAAHVPQARLLLLANAARKQVHALHYALAPGPPSAAVDFAATFAVKQPVLSMATGYEMTESEATPGVMEQHVQLYCIQPDAVQQYTLDPALCTPSDEQLAAAGGGAAAAEPGAANGAAAAGGGEAADGGGASLVPPAVLLPSPMRLLHKEAAAAPKEAAPATPANEPSPPPPPTSLAQPKAAAAAAAQQQKAAAAAAKQQEQQQKAAAAAAAAAAAEERRAAEAAAAAAAAATPAPAAEAKQQPKAKHPPGSLAPPSAMPPLPTTLASKAHTDKGAISREPSLSPELQPAVAPTVAVTPLPAGGGGGGGGDELEEGEVPRGGPGGAATGGGGGGAELAGVSRQLERLLALQQSLGAQLRSEVADGLRASEAAAAARAEAAVAKALSKRAEEDRRRSKDLEKALAQQISQANAALLAGVTKAAQDAAREQSRAVLAGAAASLGPALAAALGPPLSRAVADALARDAPPAAAAAAERAVAAALRGGAVQEAVASQFAGRVAPAVESATRAMFSQVEAALGAWLAESRAAAASSGLAAAVSQLQGVAGSLQREVAEGQRALVRLASQGGGGGPPAAAGGGAPAAAPDARGRVVAALAARDYDAAFNAALSAASPELLSWTCRQVSPAALAAAEPPPLSQICLLSLVQQLGANLGPGGGPDAELRLDWLTEVAPLLEPAAPSVAPHLRGVLGAVMGSLKALAGGLPHTDPAGRKAKLAIHVVNSLLHQ
ncbi:MAG: hypothetical protein J3K34DRAFT_494464 [Monoraphidium minutum]|nr:MAG: hypothetical protein J3K34DRAFT_494464 [Monoraphidium minutum]